MTTDSIDLCLRISLAHASLALKLDTELGTFHGLSLGDFILLRLLARTEGGRIAVADLRRPMGMQLSAVTRELIRLEKMGWVQRETAADDGIRVVLIRSVGKRLLNEALSTAEAVCAEAVRGLSLEAQSHVAAALSYICGTTALAV
jgi:DNA-binding MarR family transcriptional regulator